jgi:predicted permease
MQRALIATQLAMSMVLLVVGALFARSLHNITNVDPGFRADSLTGFNVYLPYRYSGEQVRSVVDEVTRRVAGAPGVSRVIVSNAPPFMRRNSSSPVLLDPSIANGRPAQHTSQMYVQPGYFEGMGVRLVSGRTFSETDKFGAEPVAIVNESEVKRDFGGASPIGLRVRHQSVWRTIVGVVADVRHRSLTVSDGAGIYVPFDQNPNSGPTFLVRGSPDAFTRESMRAILRDVDPRAVLQAVTFIPTAIEKSYGVARYRTILVTVFGVIAALLAAIGLYGISVRAAGRRMREVGIRMALGSTSRGVTGLLVSDAMTGVAFGIAIGFPAAMLVARATRSHLFGITPEDPTSFVVVATLLAVVTLVASVLPARRAGRTSPAVVLRSD